MAELHRRMPVIPELQERLMGWARLGATMLTRRLHH
jgi:hypothetical protein